MSINSAMQAGVSGLKANASALAAISDNIANLNTVGYKRNEVSFDTLVTNGSGAAGYSAGGVKGVAQQYVTTQGLIQTTSSALDLAISGQGFFVTTEKASNLTSSDTRLFTRAGSFTPDAFGNLKNTDGLYLQGWAADAQGNIQTDPSDLNKLVTLNVSAVGGTAEPTTHMAISANLNSETVGSATYTAGSMAAYNATTGTSGAKPDFEISVPISDSKGGQRNITMGFIKNATPANSWQMEIYGDPNQITGTTNGLITSGQVTFNTDGTLNTITPASLVDANNNLTLNVAASPPTNGGTTPAWDAGLGISAQSIQIALGGATGGLSQYNAPSNTLATTTDGTAFGNLTAIKIDTDGFVTAQFDNGVTRKIGQVAIATFGDPNSLTAVSGNAYQVSNASGPFTLRSAGLGGAGTIDPSSLESSTVDLSSELTGLITTQRAYSASSKIITTADQMLQELIDIKR